MSKKIKDVSESIKTKLSFDDYKVNTESPKHIKTESHKEVEEAKVKCTFYVPASTQQTFEDIYFKLNFKRKKITRSELIKTAIEYLKQHYKEDLDD